MNILTAGDSFTYGEELSDINNAWPFLLGRKLNSYVTNLASPAASNDKIIRKTVDHIVNYHIKPDLVIVGWTNPGRQEFADEHGYYDIWPGYDGSLYKKDNATWRSELCRYISVYHNRIHLYLKYVQQILFLQSFFKQYNIKYLMLDVTAFDYYKSQHDLFMGNYFNMIDKDAFIGFNVEGMTEWTQGTAIGPNGHFLDDGHCIVAEKVYNHIVLHKLDNL